MRSDEAAPTSYDLVPYPGNPYRESHPDQLATVARLFRLQPPPVEGCRVLELGCALGANLIPMAVSLPGAQFVGIDLSQRQIEEARQKISAVGLANIEVHHGSLTEISADWGLFDYIICHGVFSWVSNDVRECILQICSRNLTPGGVAYISYNTYPGWFMRGMVRRMMGFHARRFVEPQVQLEQSRAFLDFLAQSCHEGDPAYQALLKRELEILRQCNDSYLFHEHLEDVNEPMFFYEFVEQAARHQLRYLAEPYLRDMVAANIAPGVSEVLHKLGAGIVHYEQYLDFLRNRTFRRTLLCHADQIPNREIGPEQMAPFRITSALQRTSSGGSVTDGTPWEFAAGSQRVTATHPIHKELLARLQAAGPAGLFCEALCEGIADGLAPADGGPVTASGVRGEVLDLVLQLYLRGILEICSEPARFVSTVSDIPRASGLARLQAAEGAVVTNLRHERIRLEALDRHLVRRLDGSSTRSALMADLGAALSQGELTVDLDGGPLPADQRTPELLGTILDHGLQSLASRAVLQG